LFHLVQPIPQYSTHRLLHLSNCTGCSVGVPFLSIESRT
jgi:hypothetical protein